MSVSLADKRRTMSTTQKGNKLEDYLYQYLREQLDLGDLVFGAHPATLCELYKKKGYFCNERGRNIEFDVVVEIRRSDRKEPHLYLLFECKNHKGPVQERDITDFSDKVGRIFKHNAKGIIVSASRLQSGAERIARNRGLGIVKFDANGIDIVADRTSGSWTEKDFVEAQMLDGLRRSKSLKFSGCDEGIFFGSFQQMLQCLQPDHRKDEPKIRQPKSVTFLPDTKIQQAAEQALALISYEGGEVHLENLCAKLGLNLIYFERTLQDADGNIILGSANFNKRSIEINRHGDRNRERFTIAHEVGHFLLSHDRYLHSDAIIESDLIDSDGKDEVFNYERLEFQANIFGSMILLPEHQFLQSLHSLRAEVGISDKGFGYIFVDDQPCNYAPFNQLLSQLSFHFGTSKQVIEIRLKRAGLLTDERRNR